MRKTLATYGELNPGDIIKTEEGLFAVITFSTDQVIGSELTSPEWGWFTRYDLLQIRATTDSKQSVGSVVYWFRYTGEPVIKVDLSVEGDPVF